MDVLIGKQESSCIRVACLKLQASACNLLKKRLWQRCFPVNFGKFLRTRFLQKPPGDCFWISFWVTIVWHCIQYTLFSACISSIEKILFLWYLLKIKILFYRDYNIKSKSFWYSKILKYSIALLVPGAGFNCHVLTISIGFTKAATRGVL